MKKSILTIAAALLLVVSARGGDYFTESLSSTKVEISSAAAKLYGYKITNTNASPIYVHLYDSAAAGVTVGTTFQVDMIPVPANGAVIVAANGTPQHVFSNGITIAATTSPLYSGTTAPGTGLVVSLTWN